MAPLASLLSRRHWLGLMAGGAGSVVLRPFGVAAQDMTFFRIGTGGIAGTYYPVGALLANIISNPPGSRPCDKGGSCGVPGLVAVALASDGSVANVESITAGQIESGFCQSDIAYGAYHGTGVFEGQKPMTGLRLIANLYPETMQIVVRRGSGITTIADLKGKRVSLDARGSGTLVDARIVLADLGITEKDMKVEHVQASQAVVQMRAGELDAFFVIAGYPTTSVSDLTSQGVATLIPVPSETTMKLLASHPFFSLSVIPDGTYRKTPAIPTLAVGAQWIVSAAVADHLVYGITAALWNQHSRRLLDSGHPAARQIKLSNALDGAAIPLHPGALRYYRQAGLDTSKVPLPAEAQAPAAQ